MVNLICSMVVQTLDKKALECFFWGGVNIKSSEKIVTFIILYQKANNIEMYRTMMKRAQDKLFNN